MRRSAAENRDWPAKEAMLSSSWSVADCGVILATGLERSRAPERKTMSDVWD